MKKLLTLFLLCSGLATPSYAVNQAYQNYFLCALPKSGRALGNFAATALSGKDSTMCTAMCLKVTEDVIGSLETPPLAQKLEESGLKKDDAFVLLLSPCIQSCIKPEKPIESLRELDTELKKIKNECIKFLLEADE